jgi:intracellular sulfur oxidation DsrE/DsrF family protein
VAVESGATAHNFVLVQTVFHTSHPDQYRVVDAKVRNLLDDDTLELANVAVLVDRGGTIDAAADDLRETTESFLDAGATLKLCSNALRGATVDADEFPAGTEVVSSGVGELTRLQHDGWAYIRP